MKFVLDNSVKEARKNEAGEGEYDTSDCADTSTYRRMIPKVIRSRPSAPSVPKNATFKTWETMLIEFASVMTVVADIARLFKGNRFCD